MKETIWEGVLRGKPFKITAELQHADVLCEIAMLTEGFLHDVISGSKTFAKAHPFLTGMMAGYAWDAIDSYNKARENTLKFYAHDLTQRTHFDKIVKELVTKSGYHIVHQGYKGGSGYEWKLVRHPSCS